MIGSELQDLVGVPFLVGGRNGFGRDCLGVVLEVLRRGRPDLEVTDPWPRIREVAGAGPLELGWESLFPLVRLQPFDVLVLESAEAAGHLGIVVPGGQVLHATRVAGTVLTPIRRLGNRIRKVLRPPPAAPSGPILTLVVLDRIFPPPIQRRILRRPWSGQRASELVLAALGSGAAAAAVSVDGGPPVRGEALEALVPPPGSTVVVTPDVQGVETILVSVLLPMVLGAAMGFASQALMGPQEQLKNARGQDEESPTYVWSGIETTYKVGTRIPLIYGHHRVGGQVIGHRYHEKFARPTPTAPEAFSDHLKLLLALGEGPIYAIGDKVDGSPDQVFDAPILKGAIPGGLRVNGSDAFSAGDSAEVRPGEIHQAPIADWIGSYVTLPVAGELPAGVPYRFVTSGPYVSKVWIRVLFKGGLFKAFSTGIGYYEVHFGWRVRRYHPTTPGPWIDHTTYGQYFEGRATRQPFTYSFELIPLVLEDPGQWEIEVWRITPDDDDPSDPKTKNAQSVCIWSQIIEGSYTDEREAPGYPGTALLSLDIQATERLSGPAPNVTVPVWGRLVPYWVPILGWQERAFYLGGSSPSWPGRNPAWILADFLTARRGGLGNQFRRENIDAEAFHDWAAYCDQVVPDGAGGFERRCSCDLVVDAGKEAWEVIREICRCGDAVPILIGSKFSVKWEHARERVQVITSANAADLEVTFEDTRTRPNIIDVQILSELADFEQDMISVEDPGAIGAFEPWLLGAEPSRTASIQAFGVVRPSQARRMALFQHALNRGQDHHLRCKVGLDALAAEVGDRVGVETDVVQYFDWATRALRAREAGSAVNTVGLDAEVILEPGATYELVIQSSESTWEVRAVTSPAGTYDPGIPISFGGAPVSFEVGAVVGIGRSESVLKDYVITRMRLAEDLSAELELVPYVPEAYEAELWIQEFGDTEEVTPPEPLPGPLPAEDVTLEPTGGGSQIVSWTPPPGAQGSPVRVYVRTETGPWVQVYSGTGTSTPLPWELPAGTLLEVAVLAGAVGAPPEAGELVPVVLAAQEWPAASPPTPSGLMGVAHRGIVALAWAPVAGASDYEVRLGPYWAGGLPLGRTALPQWRGELPPGEATLLVRARDAVGMISGGVAEVALEVLPPEGLEVESVTDLLEVT